MVIAPFEPLFSVHKLLLSPYDQYQRDGVRVRFSKQSMAQEATNEGSNQQYDWSICKGWSLDVRIHVRSATDLWRRDLARMSRCPRETLGRSSLVVMQAPIGTSESQWCLSFQWPNWSKWPRRTKLRLQADQRKPKWKILRSIVRSNEQESRREGLWW